MKNKILLVSLALFSLFFSACIESPLLNHADASPGGAAKPQEKTENAKDCAFRYSKLKLCASLTWARSPDEESGGEFILKFWNFESGGPDGPYVDPMYGVFVKLWMPSMGHGSSPVTVEPFKNEAGEQVIGVFKASKVYFVMSGAWEIWVQLKEEKKIIDQAKIDVQI